MDEKSKVEMKLEVWKKTVDVQMHFNDLCLRLRHVGISILGVLLGGAALAYRYGNTTSVFSYDIQTSVIFITIALIIWIAFYLMDRFWYHELLKGAVHHGLKIEESLNNELSFVMIGLAGTIRDQSHASLKMNAGKKLDIFYGVISCVLTIALFVLFFPLGIFFSILIILFAIWNHKHAKNQEQKKPTSATKWHKL